METLNNNTTPETEINSGAETQTKAAEEKLSFTKEELDALIQSQSDKRVQQALKTQEKKQEQKLREAEKLANMSAEQKYIYELEEREKAIEAKEAELALAENKNICAKILADKGISLDLVDFVVAGDAEEMNTNIKKLDKAFKASVKAEVERRLSQKTPSAKTVGEIASLTKEQFSKLSLAEMQHLAQTEPEVYNSLIS